MFLRPKNKIVDLIFSNIKIVFLLFLFLVSFGVLSLSQMQRQGFPEVLINVASVSVVYPNASAAQVEDQVLEPLEAAISDLDSVTEYQSVAADSYGSVFVTFDQNIDLDDAFAELKNEVVSVDLPEDAQEPSVNKFSASGVGEFVVSVSGFHGEEDLYEAGAVLEDELKDIDGVKEVTATNPLTPEIVITFNRDDLDEHGVTRAQAEEVIKSSQLSLPVGSFEDDDAEVGVILKKEVNTLYDLEHLLIAQDVELRDVADVEISLNNNDSYNRIGFREDGDIDEPLRVERSLSYAVKIDKDADIILVAEDINELTDRLNDEYVGSVSDGKGSTIDEPAFLTVYSQADSTELQLKEITSSIFGAPIEALGPFGFIGYLLGGVGLVVILLLIFMNLRVALMAAASIPLSLFFAAIYLNLAGIDLNTLVLFSMVLTVGLVVDPTIVYLESLQRYKSQGLTGQEAAAKTVQTVGLGVFLAVATNVLVFVPFGVVSGFFGEIIKYIPATVIPAMIASMVIPVLFFMPLASKILSSKRFDWNVKDSELIGTWRIARKIGSLIRWILGEGKTKVVLRGVLFVFIMALPFITGGALVGSGAIEVVQFSEQDDSDYMLITGDISSEWTFEKAATEIVSPMQEELKNYPEIKTFSFYEQSGNSFAILATLYPYDVRQEEDMRTSDEVGEAMNDAFARLGLSEYVEASTSSEGPPQDTYPVRVRLMGDDAEALAAAAEDIKEYLADVDGITESDDNISEGTSGGSVVFVLDNDEALNINPFYTYSVLNERLAVNELGDIELDGETYEIVSEYRPGVTSQSTLTKMRVMTPEEIAYEQQLLALEAQGLDVTNGIPGVEEPAPVFVRDLIDETTELESTRIQRINGERYVEVYAAVDEDADALAIQADLEEYLDADKLESYGLDEDAADFKGSADSIEESFSDLFLALAIAVFMIYVLLVAFFRSYLEPFIILMAIPLGLVGVFGAVAATTGQLGFLELLGVVAMAGIVVNVTILLIDYANQLQREGKSPADAIATAVSVRFRPIVLTQLTAFGSLIPLVYLSPFWKGLAAAIIFGIISSALLSLFVTPILYLWANSITTTASRVPEFFRKLAIAYKSIK